MSSNLKHDGIHTGANAPDDVAILAEVQSLVADGCHAEALSLLRDACAISASPALQQRLVDLRIQAFPRLDFRHPQPSVELNHDGRFSSEPAIPQIEPAALNAGALRAGIVGRGALIVRGLLSSDQCAWLRTGIDNTLEARRAMAAGETGTHHNPWYVPSATVAGGPVQFDTIGADQYTNTGSVWSAYSPPSATYLIDCYERIGLQAMLRDYFGEPAVLSVKKWVLRCIAPSNGSAAGWHQDGRFLGDSIRTVNLWIALNDCGGDTGAPGLDIVAGDQRVIYDTGTHGADFEWTVGQGLVDRICEHTPACCPRFAAGDAIFFDHYNLHRTAFGTSHVHNRYAVESWFFAASTAPPKQIPLVFDIPQGAG